MIKRHLRPAPGVCLIFTVLAALHCFCVLVSAWSPVQYPPSQAARPQANLDQPVVTATQHTSGWLELLVRSGELRARLSLRVKERALAFYPERRRSSFGIEWPLFADIAPLLRAALQTAIPDPQKMPAFTFSFRLVMYPEMSYRLALQALASKNWDRQHGRARSAFTNSFIMNLATNNNTYPELTGLFAAMGYRTELVTLATVRAAQVRELPYRGELQAEGVAPQVWVPYDAILSFKIQRLQ